MIRVALVACATAALVVLAPRSARCELNAMRDVLYLGFGFIVVGDLAITGYDVSQAAEGERAIDEMAVTEIAVAAPQFLVAGAVAINEKSTILPELYTLWMAGLVTHGILTLSVGPMDAPPPPGTPPPPGQRPERRIFTIAPTVLNDGMRTALVPGMGVSGRF